MTDPLVALVARDRTDEAIEALRAEGVYDDDRRVRPVDGDRIAIPIRAEPTETTVLAVEADADPRPRTPGLDDRLREAGFTDGELARVPSSWAVVGSVILARFTDCPREREVAEALLALHGNADTVLAREGIDGRTREPSVRVVAGTGRTETVHVEDGTRYALDVAEVMFSPGNHRERRRMGEVVDADERVFDMFAGIGYFALPMARAGARVVAAEHNPVAFRYLIENAALNDVTDRLSGYRADCREVASAVAAGEPVDRVVMGYYGVDDTDGDPEGSHAAEAPDEPTGRDERDRSDSRADAAHEYLDVALEVVRDGGVIHYHEATPEPLLWDRPIERVERAAALADVDATVLERRRVKSHSEGVAHVVLDVRIER